MRFYIIAGEASGDLHASNLVKEMKLLDKDCSFRGIGGDLMNQEGVELVKHFRETAFMGFWEVFSNLRKILGYIELVKKDIQQWNPDAIILVDYPGFNLRIAKYASGKGFKVYYYISPQVWAWKASRISKMKQTVNRLFVILPFEKEFYHKWGMEVTFVGHPLLDATERFIRGDDRPAERKQVALLPGSRKQEIGKMLPVMLQVVQDFPHVDFVIAGVGSIDIAFYKKLIGDSRAELVINKTYQVLSDSSAALVTSGTATLEAALFGVPEIVCYKGSPLSFWIGKQLVDVKYISLVNLILDRPLVKELIQQDFTAARLRQELDHLLNDDRHRKNMQDGYRELKEKLGGKGASAVTARAIMNSLNH